MPYGVWTLWDDTPPPVRKALRAVYRELRAEHAGLTSPLAKRYAKSTAELWAVTDALSQEAAVLALTRKTGQGRRANRRLVQQAAKRQALHLGSLDGALAKLAAIVAKDRAKKLAVLPRRMA